MIHIQTRPRCLYCGEELEMRLGLSGVEIPLTWTGDINVDKVVCKDSPNGKHAPGGQAALS